MSLSRKDIDPGFREVAAWDDVFLNGCFSLFVALFRRAGRRASTADKVSPKSAAVVREVIIEKPVIVEKPGEFRGDPLGTLQFS